MKEATKITWQEPRTVIQLFTDAVFSRAVFFLESVFENMD